jgi:hypothetical protein
MVTQTLSVWAPSVGRLFGNPSPFVAMVVAGVVVLWVREGILEQAETSGSCVCMGEEFCEVRDWEKFINMLAKGWGPRILPAESKSEGPVIPTL